MKSSRSSSNRPSRREEAPPSQESEARHPGCHRILKWLRRHDGWRTGLAVLAFASGCSAPGSGHAPVASCCATNTEFAATALTDKSLYQLDSTWTNDFGQPMKLSSLHGQVQVVAMFFASCQYACPVLVQNMKRLEAALPESIRGRVGFTLVTFDTERDTPKALRTYRERQQLDAGRWTLLSAAPDDTLELAALLGVQYKREVSGQFAHSNVITVLNQDGEIIHQHIGLNQAPQESVQAIERAVKGSSRVAPDDFGGRQERGRCHLLHSFPEAHTGVPLIGAVRLMKAHPEPEELNELLRYFR